MDFIPYVTAIIKNFEAFGLLRYDPCDVDDFLSKQRRSSQNDFLRKGFRACDVIAPILTRKLLGIKKSAQATTYYHLGMAFLLWEQLHIPVDTSLSAVKMAELLLQNFYDPSSALWRFSDVNYSFEAEEADSTKTVTMPMHGLARSNILLLAVWRQYQREDLLNISIESAAVVLRQHNITEYDDGSAAISYYYNSQDNTLNVNSEFLQWIAEIPADRRPAAVEALGHRILKMLLREQNKDGSFYYLGKEYMRQNHLAPTIDNHHSSYMLNNLIHIYMSDFPTEKEKDALLQACVRGMEFSLSHLFDEQTGMAVYQINNATRKADPVSYSEAALAFCAYLRCPEIPAELNTRIQRLLPKVVARLTAFVNLKNGSVPSACVFGKWNNINSIRWGNGPVLQAILDVYALEQGGT